MLTVQVAVLFYVDSTSGCVRVLLYGDSINGSVLFYVDSTSGCVVLC